MGSIQSICPYHLSELSFIDAAEIWKVITKSAYKSCKLDPIPTVLLKECVDILLPVITVIINQSLATGVVPDVFKSAVVTPMIKKANPDANILNNYRNNSNLCFLSKQLLERVVLPQTLGHIHMHNLLPQFQSAYRLYHSTETALLRVQNNLLRTLDDGNEALLIFLDCSATFDTIDHRKLLHRLVSRFGFSGTVISW